MNDAALPPGYLGPATEARFAEAFAHKALVGCEQAADLIGVDPKTLEGLPILAKRTGSGKRPHRRYTERALRNWLLEDHDEPCAPAQPRTKARSAAAGNVHLVNFSERRRKR